MLRVDLGKAIGNKTEVTVILTKIVRFGLRFGIKEW